MELPDKSENGSVRSESVGSERERLHNNASPFWRPMVESFNSIETKWEMVWLFIFGLATMVLPLISLLDMVNNSTNDDLGKPLVLLTVLLTMLFICAAIFVSLVLIYVTNDWSVSVMLAQRWNPVSYVATYFITALCHFASAWVCSIYVMRHMNGLDDPEWKIVCSTLSLIFIALSQLFPPAIKVKPGDLGLGELVRDPNTNTYNISYATIVTTTATEIIPTLLPFEKPFEFVSTVIHYALRLSGSIVGYYVIICFLNNYGSWLKFNLAMSFGMIIVSAVLEFSALIVMFSMISRSTAGYKEARFMRTFFGLEACFLYCMIIGVVLAVMAESQLFEHYTG